jgi:hypothetical protein
MQGAFRFAPPFCMQNRPAVVEQCRSPKMADGRWIPLTRVPPVAFRELKSAPPCCLPIPLVRIAPPSRTRCFRRGAVSNGSLPAKASSSALVLPAARRFPPSVAANSSTTSPRFALATPDATGYPDFRRSRLAGAALRASCGRKRRSSTASPSPPTCLP